MYTLLLGLSLLIQTSIYTLQVSDTNGMVHAFSQFQGKKIMLVNIATGSERVNQLAALQQLHEQHGDSLVIIAFPSNSFGNEERSDAEIKLFCQSGYNTGFIIAAKNPVTGPGAQVVFGWLGNSTQNGDLNIPIVDDFQKILIDKDGYIIAVFAPEISPIHSSVIAAIASN